MMEGGDCALSGGQGDMRLSWYLAHGDLSKVSSKYDEIGLNNKFQAHLKTRKRRKEK
jgi:hypothetical protein